MALSTDGPEIYLHLAQCQLIILPADAQVDLKQNEFHPEEWLQAKAIRSEPRRIEYLRARWLLHRFVSREHNFSRQPQGFVHWPADWLGSISHSQGHVAVAISKSFRGVGVGLDLERVERIRTELKAKICTAGEREKFFAHDGYIDQRLLLAHIFAAKEALYKAVFPSGLRQFWFEDAEMTQLSENFECGEIRLLVDAAPQAEAGKRLHIHFHQINIGGEKLVAAICCYE